jgi:hypothetical protein
MWNTQNPNANFRLELRRSGETSWNTLGPRLTGNTYALQNLETGTAYQIRVAQVCENNLSDYSNTLRFTTQNCEEPQKITLQNVGYTAATLAFTGPPATKRITKAPTPQIPAP